MRRALVTASILLSSVAHAERPMCRPGETHHGAKVDLDVEHADIEEVFRLLADVARVNIVVAEGVHGTVTLELRRAPWDAILCAVAALHQLTVTVDGNIVLVKK